MKIFYNGEYYKILHVPKTYEEFLTKILKVCCLQDVAPKLKLHYIDEEKFPINISCDEHYQVMLEEIKNMTMEIIVLLSSDLEKEIDQDQGTRENLSIRQSSWIKAKVETEIEPNRFVHYNSPNTTLEESSIGNENDNILKPYDAAANTSVLLLENKESPQKAKYKLEKEEKVAYNSTLVESKQPIAIDFLIKDPKSGKSFTQEIKENSTKVNEKKKKKTIEKESTRPRDPPNEADLIENGDKVTKKVQTSHVRNMNYKPEGKDKDAIETTTGALTKLKEKWKQNYIISFNPEQGQIKIEGFQEKISKLRFKPTFSINDQNLIEMLKELIQEIKDYKDYKASNILDLKIDLKNCAHITSHGIADAINFIDQNFLNLTILSLDFSFDKMDDSKIKRKKDMEVEIKFSLKLKKLKTLEINLVGRCDVASEEMIELSQEISINLQNLQELTIKLPVFYSNTAAISHLKKKLGFVSVLHIN